MQISIREAKKADCARILELVHELAVFEHAPEEVTVSFQEFEEAGFGEKPVWKAFVAEVGGKIEGFALYYTRFSTWKGCRLYLEDFYVTQKMRAQGIGKMLFETIVKEAGDKNFNGMSWQVLDWNQPAIDFYNKYGSRMEAGWLNASLSAEQISAGVGSINAIK